jgi:uncharacterized protein (TIGR02421 family)
MNKSKTFELLHQIDEQLFNTVKGVNILNSITPVNFTQAKREFFESNFSVNPDFAYQKKKINYFKRKRDLFNLPIDKLKDDDLFKLYNDIIESYIDKLNLHQSVGTPDFLYDSLRHFGEPTGKDIRNAQFILHLPDDIEDNDDDERLLKADKIIDVLKDFAKQNKYKCKFDYNENMIANALVSGTKVNINPEAKVTLTEANALAHHELGVHLVTTLNARSQPLKALSLGCPVNTTTQEGLAILCEYLSGNLTLSRLKTLALRVVAVDSMVNDKDFRTTFLLLKEQYKIKDDKAFTITARAYRGGGYTKDYLYLQGIRKMLNAYETNPNFNNLLIGKTSYEYLPLLTRLIEKGYLHTPKYVSPAIANPQDVDQVHQFITHAVK